MAAPGRRRSTGTKRTASAVGSSSSRASSRRSAGKARYVVCVSNEGFQASLERRKLYERTPDIEAEKAGFIRVVDESGEDYLFPRAMFVDIDVPLSVARALSAAA